MSARPPARLELDDRDLRRGLGQLVILLVDLIRELLARQAVRRFRSGSLTDEQAERLGDALHQLEGLVGELRDLFGVGEHDEASPLVLTRTGVTEPTREPTPEPTPELRRQQ